MSSKHLFNMNNFLKYLLLICLVGLGLFKIYVEWIKADKRKPTIYIDNYSGSPIEIYRKNEVWVSLFNESSTIKKNLNVGTHFLYIHKLDEKLIDTLRIDIRESKKYILNTFQAMNYYEGEVLYQKRPESQSYQSKDEIEISDIFFQTTADFILDQPASDILVYSKNKAPKNFNTKSKRKYLRRGNQNW